MKKLQTEIQISAPAQKVWSVLMDFERYPEWNPFIRIEGRPVVGSQLKNTMTLAARSPQVFKPEVLVVEENKEFRWLGRLFIPGLFDGEHYFRLEAIDDNTTRLVHGEHFRGMLVGLLMRMIGEDTRASFERMNVALKKRVEEK
jgi:hypothetical protein